MPDIYNFFFHEFVFKEDQLFFFPLSIISYILWGFWGKFQFCGITISLPFVKCFLMGNVLFDFMVWSLYGSFLNAWLYVKNYLQGKWRRLVLTLVNKFPLCTKISSISMISFSHFLNLFFISKKKENHLRVVSLWVGMGMQ